ncbi:unnamed protein product [Camellia sinensis]
MKETEEVLEFCREKGLTSQIEVVKMDYINKRAGKHAVCMEEEDGASGEAGLGEEDGGELNEPARLAGEAVDDGDYSDDSVMGFVAADGRYV